ncbi:DEAD/DEAH box helicase family protein [Aliarcobacter cryaerophilus]|jgi:type I restriction enzyme R subunit|uniref:EcoAI/FtnUII family type I restriction enzme subunit R n=1 Tax=Aliarcobacter cryaerophilus TaxID=28198 RepID=UPI003DA275F5
MSSKKELTERDICTKYINPALTQAGWNLQTQIREEVYFTDGKIYVKGNKSKRAKGKKADYILYYKPNIPVAIIEAKDNNHRVQDGIQQGLEYANILDIPVVFSSNGDEFYEHDKTLSNGVVERKISLNNFPTPDELWERYKKYKKIETQEEEKIISQDYFFDAQGKFPRYYQQIAINRTVEAIAKGQNRILLVMATGTGKTYTAFQIIHRLWKSGAKKRILFLADRNALIDQTKKGDFRHFKDKMTVIRKKHIDKSYEIYLALYQGLTNYDEDKDAYKEFSSDFFDLIVIDEAHRGSASEDSSWREILDYFSSATQIGLTATPKETKTISNIEYFGESVYTYTLKEGIDDGFLAPYKVLRVGLNVDLEDYEPEIGKKDKDGNEIEQRIYNRKDFDRSLVIDERTYMVAQRVTEFLKATDRFSKTIIFCTDIDHASRMRSAIANLNSDLVAKNSKYVMQITGDNDEGKRELDNFINPQETYPVIATTSKLMTTGVDAQTCKLIVLDSNIGSMTEFKQIIGRGTRINEEYGKTFFTIMDFRGATDKFADPDFDGESVMIKDIFDGDEILNPEEEKIDSIIDENGEEIIFEPFNIPDAGEIEDIEKKKREKVYINGVDVTILNERVQIRNSEGKLITTSYKEYSKQKVHEEFSSLDDFLNRWSSSEKKQVIIDELYEKDILFEELKVDIGKDMDIFDLICHIAYDKPPLTRKERANSVQKRDYFNKYEGKAKEILKALLEKYSDEGIETIETIEVLKLPEFSSFGTAIEIVNTFGGRDKYLEAIKDLENEIYKGVA